jgi:hypothetical protein
VHVEHVVAERAVRAASSGLQEAVGLGIERLAHTVEKRRASVGISCENVEVALAFLRLVGIVIVEVAAIASTASASRALVRGFRHHHLVELRGKVLVVPTTHRDHDEGEGGAQGERVHRVSPPAPDLSGAHAREDGADGRTVRSLDTNSFSRDLACSAGDLGFAGSGVIGPAYESPPLSLHSLAARGTSSRYFADAHLSISSRIDFARAHS